MNNIIVLILESFLVYDLNEIYKENFKYGITKCNDIKNGLHDGIM